MCTHMCTHVQNKDVLFLNIYIYNKKKKNHPKDVYTHRCYDLGKPKNISVHNELKKVRIKWPQFVGYKDIPIKHTQ
jgi:hypothetical protein